MQTYESPAQAVPPPPDSQFATRTALLDAAERLFSQNGIEGTSVRDIIKEAGTNLGAIITISAQRTVWPWRSSPDALNR